MYLLVRDWTGSPSAGITAGLLYAFHGARISLATYPFIIDLAWTLFALRFGERYFKQGRWRDALLAALCIALQLSMSLYASLVCVLVLLPYLVWLLTKYGLAKLRPGPVIVALVVIGLSTALVYAPYLWLPETSGNPFRYVALWSGFLPGRFVGWLIFLFALVSLLPGWREKGASRRWALLAACALVLWLATGGNEAAQYIAEKAGDPAPLALLSPYRILDFLPGLARIRGPSVLASGVHGCAPDPMDTAPLEAGHLGRTDLRRIRGYAPPGASGPARAGRVPHAGPAPMGAGRARVLRNARRARKPGAGGRDPVRTALGAPSRGLANPPQCLPPPSDLRLPQLRDSTRGEEGEGADQPAARCRRAPRAALARLHHPRRSRGSADPGALPDGSGAERAAGGGSRHLPDGRLLHLALARIIHEGQERGPI